MVEPFIINRIYAKAKLLGNNLSKKEIKNKINHYSHLPQLKGCKILYDYIFLGFSSLSASSSIYHLIVVSAKWIENVVIYDDEKITNAFILTLGHELAHKDGDFIGICFNSNDRKFIHWVTEVHHDFAAAKKMVYSSRAKLLESITYKISVKPNNKDTISHPSWFHRKEYVENYDFNEVLISLIADKTKCKNKNLIKKVIKHYTPITLA